MVTKKLSTRKMPANYRIMGRDIVVTEPEYERVQDKNGHWVTRKSKRVHYRIVGQLRGERTRL